MSATELKFRTSTFGGFQKQDVLNYIEQNNKEHTEKCADLGRELDEIRQAKHDLEASYHIANTQVSSMTAEQVQLSNALEEAKRTGEQATAQRDELTARVAELEGELAALKTRLAKAEPAAEAYEHIKDRTAGVELEAHHRATTVQEAAHEQVRKTRSDMEHWVTHLKDEYNQLCAKIDDSIAAAAAELNNVCLSLEDISHTFEAGQTALDRLGDTCQEKLGHHAPQPQPLPLDEKVSPIKR